MAITLRGNKSQALTFNEMDGNFTDLDGRVTTLAGSTVQTINGLSPSSNAITITTANITENTNLYYTDARSRAAISVTDSGGDGSLSYNSSTGVITYTGPSASDVRAHFSAGEGIDISSGEISGEDASTSNKGIASFNTEHFTVSSGAVSLKAGSIDDTHIDFGTGANQISTDDLPEGSTNVYYTDARVTTRLNASSINDLSDVDTISSTPNANDVLTWNAIDGEWEPAVAPGASGGEANTGSSLGSGSAVFKSKVGVDLQFRSLIGTSPIVATENTNDVTLSFAPSADFDVNTQKIINVVDPSSAQDAATKAYVDSQVSATDLTIGLAGDSGSSSVSTSQTLTINGTANEVNTSVSGQTVTVGLPNNVTVANDLTVGNALTVTGNLTVQGTTTTINASDLAITDSKIQLAVGNESSDVVDIGFVGHYFNGVRIAHAGFFRDATDKKFKLFGDYGVEPDQPTIDTDDANFTLADLQLRSLEIGDTDNPSMAIRGSRLETINSNQDIELETSGTGIVNIGANVQLKAQSDLRFADSDSSNWVAFQAPATVSSNVTWTLPNADAVVSGYALVSNASGTLSWAAAGATTTADETTNAEEQIYFGDITSGAVTAVHHDTGLTYNPSTGTLTSAVFSGAGTSLTGTAASLSIGGNAATATSATSATTATTATNVTVADESTDTSCNILYVTSATGNLPPKTGTNLTFNSSNGTLNATTFNGALNGNANTATSLETARNIGGVSFDGSANINLPGVNTSGNQDTSGTAAIATTVTVADESSDTTCNVLFTTAATGNLAPKSGTNLTFNSSNGTLAATTFSGVATSAEYADLAEKYTTDEAYLPGTVMTVGGDAETTAASSSSQYIAGVISTDPAYLMNSTIDGQAIALVGRVPVRVVGNVTKGQAVFATDNGVASTDGTGPIVGIALETNSNLDEKSVECMLKV
jgi:hypothetical protein